MATVKNTFWRLDPDDADDGTAIIGTPALPLPDDSAERPRAGHGIVVASWDEDRREGRIHALGLVVSVDTSSHVARVDWQLANFTVSPSAQGCAQWRTRRFFKFDAGPAKRYALNDHFADKFAGTPSSPRETSERAQPDAPRQAGAMSPISIMPTAPTPPSASVMPVLKPRSTPPQRNRVSPSGDLVATEARGTLMGNRADHMRWLVCELHFERQLNQPRKYTKVFFLDEAVALAAGHRPCQTCRRARYQDYLAAVRSEHGVNGAPDLDRLLRDARQAQRVEASLDSLPDGTFITLGDGDYLIVWRGSVHKWTPHGYTEPIAIVDLGSAIATVVTPSPSLAALRRGYRTVPHPSIARELL